ncbi:hypothetical protein [Sphingomonas sp. DT-204]|uniref:hypothetical protein n=1 Tax=Sphingomonas sp. DT-204 TaxID=3396166 RepID=UPI003F1D3CF0
MQISASNPGVGDVFGQVVVQIGVGPFLIGLVAVCAVLAYNIFAARAATTLLHRIQAGAEPVTASRSGRMFYLDARGRRVYRPDLSDTEAVKAWYAKIADNREAYAEHRSGSASRDHHAPGRDERRRNREAYEARRNASYREAFPDTYSDVHRDHDD